MLKRIGARCPRCGGQIVYFHTDDYPACFQCGHEPAPKDLAEVLKDFEVKTCRKCTRVLRSGTRPNRAGLCTDCSRAGGTCSLCGGPTGTDNTAGICRKCFREGARGGAYSEASREGAQRPRRSDYEPELAAGLKARGARVAVD